MNIAVLMRPVPDPVEELEISQDGADLDRDYLGYVVNEFDEHALEEGLLIKEEVGGTITVLAPGSADEIDDILYTALAKGADRAVRLGSDVGPLDAHSLAKLFTDALSDMEFDLVLTGVQAADELTGQVSALVASMLRLPHISVATAARPTTAGVTVTKEFWAGITADYEVVLPAVLGVQAARQAPRYVAISRIRQAQQGDGLAEAETAPPPGGSVTVTAMRLPDAGDGAEMLGGDAEAAAERIIEILRAAGVVQGG